MFSKRLTDTIAMLLWLNVDTSSSSRNVSFFRSVTTYQFSQQWTSEKLLILSYFIKKNTAPQDIGNEQITQLLKHESEKQLEKCKKIHMLRARWGALFFLLAILGFVALVHLIKGSFMDVPGHTKVYSAVLWLAGLSLFWFNRIQFPSVKKALAKNSLTLEDCEYVYDELPKKRVIKWVLHAVSLLLLIAAIVLIGFSGIS